MDGMKKSSLFLLLTGFVYAGCTDETPSVLQDNVELSVTQTRSIQTVYTSSDKDVCFGASLKYDDGQESDVAINASHSLLEVHEGLPPTSKMWFHVGTADGMTVNWSGSKHYDDGVDPSVSLNDNNIAVEVHRGISKTISKKLVKKGWLRYYTFSSYYKMWYHVGVLNGTKMKWGSSVSYSKGEEPDVALNNKGYCVEVHRSDNNLFYCIGKVNTNKKRIDFKNAVRFTTSASEPKVAINNNDKVVSLYYKTGGKIYCRAGQIKGDYNSISWGNEYYLGKGDKCDVALSDAGNVISTYVLNGQLYQITGVLNGSNKRISWGTSTLFDKGTYIYEQRKLIYPAVAIASDASLAVQVHTGRSLSQAPNLEYSTSLFLDRMNWMNEAGLGNKKIKQICLPGSHDSGTFSISTSSDKITWDNGTYQDESKLANSVAAPFAKTQDQTILEQLKSGTRFFDFRPYYKGTGDRIYASHMLVGESFKKMLNDVRIFMNSTKGEIVVLNISHFTNFDNSDYSNPNLNTCVQNHTVLARMINNYLGHYLYKNTSHVSLGNLSYNQIVSQNSRSSKVIVIYKKVSGLSNSFYSENGFFTSGEANIYDNYANTINYKEMRIDQLSKLKQYSGSNQLFLLSWTLTVNFDNVDTAAKSLASMLMSRDMSGLSNICNMELGSFMAKDGSPYWINVLLTDYVERSRATDCAILLNCN
jgi:hypothetical protein